MTHCDFSVRSARDENIVGSSEPDAIFGSGKGQNRGCKKKDKGSHGILVRAETARGRYFVHVLTSEVNSTKIMAVLGTRTAVADLCMFWLAARDEGGPEIVNASERTITNARQVGVRLRSEWHRHASSRSC